MKIMIASDIHGSRTHLDQLLAAYEREQPGRLLLLGDILYHGPRNDLPDGYAPRAVFEALNQIADRILCVRGNCDSEVDQMVLDFPIMADCACLCAGTRAVLATHGHLHGPDNPPRLAPGDVLLSGHTHVPAWENRGGYYCFNPGSVSLPKENSHHGYMTMERDHFMWKTLSGEVYHEEAL